MLKTPVVRLGVPHHSAWSAIVSEEELSPLTPIPVPSSANAEATEEEGGVFAMFITFFTAETQQPSKGEAPVTYLAIPSQALLPLISVELGALRIEILLQVAGVQS